MTDAEPENAPAKDEDRRRRAIDLLEANHTFPCAFSLSVIARNDEAVTAAVLAAAGLTAPLSDEAHQIKPSQGGKYVSHRLLVPCASAEAVLDLYARMRGVEGVITLL